MWEGNKTKIVVANWVILGWLALVSSKIRWFIITVDLWTQITDCLIFRKFPPESRVCLDLRKKGGSKKGRGWRKERKTERKKKSRLYFCLHLGKRIWQPELQSTIAPQGQQRGHTLRQHRKQKGKQEEEKHVQTDMLHWRLEAQIHLHARDETVQLPPGIEKRKEVRKEWRVQSLGLILPG